MSVQSHAEHHWEMSWAPMAVAVGVYFLVPIGFTSYFHYENTGMAMASVSIGVIALVAGISQWIGEGFTHKHEQFGYAVSGLPIFISSEAVIFLGLFVSYWSARLMQPEWPPEGTPHINLLIPSVMTVILVSSSFTIHHAEAKLEEGDEGGFRRFLFATIALGLLFLCFTIYEYNHLVHEGFVPSTNIYSTSFFSITGFHAAHVLVGVAIFMAVALPALRGKIHQTFVKCASMYWHFVDVIWFFVVTQIYFW